jgi:hypothetical protein
LYPGSLGKQDDDLTQIKNIQFGELENVVEHGLSPRDAWFGNVVNLVIREKYCRSKDYLQTWTDVVCTYYDQWLPTQTIKE